MKKKNVGLLAVYEDFRFRPIEKVMGKATEIN